jgi:uncharacterized membrane protein
MHAEDLRNILNGTIDGVDMNQEFLLSFAFIMELPMLMILLSRLLKENINRILNIVFGFFLLIIQAWSLTVGSVTLHYWFFSIIEIGTCASILLIAWKWKTSTSP